MIWHLIFGTVNPYFVLSNSLNLSSLKDGSRYFGWCSNLKLKLNVLVLMLPSHELLSFFLETFQDPLGRIKKKETISQDLNRICQLHEDKRWIWTDWFFLFYRISTAENKKSFEKECFCWLSNLFLKQLFLKSHSEFISSWRITKRSPLDLV